MEDIEFCKADFLYMLSELNEYAVTHEIKNVWISHFSKLQAIDFTHFDSTYKNGCKAITIYRDTHTHEEAYEKFERMMKCMKEGALLVN
ncbi:hypothetical protein ETI08_01205 [Macrococcoides goetzii]|nr:hypothetical protein [Macrococcus goetzii]TDM47780.1 hypothetical protein ETI08_01205 [Macrococcus goetzii]